MTVDRETLFAELRERARSYALRHLPSVDADDIAQEVMAALASTYSEKTDPTELTRLTLKIAVNRTKDHWRTVARARQVPIGEKEFAQNPDIIVTLGTEQLIERFRAVIPKLAQPCRSLVVLRLSRTTTEGIRQHLGLQSKKEVYDKERECYRRIRPLLTGSRAMSPSF